jgi:nucleotide-binding universal stress UspA family protein
MAIKDILLYLDNSPSCPSRIELAVYMARTHGAHLKGLYVVSHSYYAPRLGRAEAEIASRAEALFAEKTKNAGISVEWLYVDWPVIGTSIPEIIDRYAFYTDLVIVSQPDHSAQSSGTPGDLSERLGLGTGRPVLVVPYAGSFPTCGERVMIAWKSGRESSRAVNDAMSVLEKARHVSVVTIATPNSPDDNAEQDASMLCTYLSRHQISATHDQILTSTSFPVGDVLLNNACEHKMDLLVMGAFAPTRRGAYLLGPVAKHLMNHMTVPLLISH